MGRMSSPEPIRNMFRQLIVFREILRHVLGKAGEI
jgi:hypothetical protein